MQNVILKQTDNAELEAILPPDRVISIDNGIVYLADTQFYISDDMIQETL